MDLSWMAWTKPVAAFFIIIACFLVTLTVWEIKVPGGAPRKGILGFTTTRGDRLFVSLLGSAYIFLAWLAFIDPPLWGPLAIAAAWTAFVFRKV